MNLFHLTTVTETISAASAEVGDVDSREVSEPTAATCRETLDAIQGGCWDSIDVRTDCLICYPADCHQDMYSGDYEREQLIIYGRPSHIARLARLYSARKPHTYIQ